MTSKQFDAVIIISAGLNVFQEDQQRRERDRNERILNRTEEREEREKKKYTSKERSGKTAMNAGNCLNLWQK